ncbi:Cys-tRNA(Pro) deacylase [Campylobacter gastrosuis]|uniref:Cys-tRNA(Pro)/Cys-tRNA(Cys) deacylase n=1 Tax=Campylobacter gastrosuis TaxID=2974576 RepID=A0ABT7HQU3_9BACT|nr:Cys-tRNA(Pro) deacylase [Campylobacter gastrosuis]MDL0089235.1 Cys-tRNA(Pro) deacylase [Campylobacter gastrosuis]
MIHKTNAARVLDRLKIAYDLVEYEVDESDLSATHVAHSAGLDIRFVYKTIVCVCVPQKYVVGVIRGDAELDLKALAGACGAKRAELINLRDLEKLTGYIRGGCSPIAMKKQFETFIDDDAQNLDYILVSAGVRGKQLKLAPNDLVKAINARFAKIIRG